MMATVVQAPAPDNIPRRVVIKRNGSHYLYMMRMYPHLPKSVVKDRILALYLQGQPCGHVGSANLSWDWLPLYVYVNLVLLSREQPAHRQQRRHRLSQA